MKGLFIIPFILTVVCLSGCKKDYDCQCYLERNGSTPSSGTVTIDGSYVIHTQPKKADSECKKKNTQGHDQLGDYQKECAVVY